MNAYLFITLNILGLALLLFLSACFSGAETALFSLTRTQVRRLGKTPGAPEKAISELLSDPSRLLTTILLGNMVVNILFASIIASLCHRFIGRQDVLVAIVLSTFLILVFGDVTPTIVGARHPLPLARWLAIPIRALGGALGPLRWGLRLALRGLMALLGQQNVPSWGMLTREQVASLLAAGAAEGATSAKGQELAQNILELPRIRARDIMVPRTAVVGAADSLTLAEAYSLACSHRHSRLPVYHGSLDDIWGVLTITEVPRWRDTPLMRLPLAELRPKATPATASAPTPVRPIPIFPDNARVEILMTEMRRHHHQLALLVDEYGGTAGVLTLQDILAEILGKLSPARMADETLFVPAGNGILVEGQASLRELNRRLSLGLSSEHTDTIGGYVMERLGCLPRAGDAFAEGRLRFQVLKMAGRRIGAVRIEKTDSSPWEVDQT